VDVSQFLGKTMLANVAYQEENSYPNIIGHMPLPEEMTCPETDEELLFFTVNAYDHTTFQKLSKKTQEKIMESEEMQIGSGANEDPKNVHNHSPDKLAGDRKVAIEDVPF